MKSTILKMLVSIFCLQISLHSFEQNVTINYQTWNPSNAPCDIFDFATNVPATINGTNSVVQHVTLRGDVKYNTTDQSVQLDNNYVNSTNVLGTSYRLAYNFKVGYRYIITVTAAELSSTAGLSNGPYLKLELSNSSSNSFGTCQGPQVITNSYSGNPVPVQFSSTAFQDVYFVFSPALTSAYSQLEVTSMPGQISGSVNSIRIRKIVIAETAPAPSVSISPASVSKTCGTALSSTFTATTANFPTGTISYLWNLGSASNGWLYNGVAAPQTITTSANTLTLTAAACSATPGNVFVTATVNSTNYTSNTATVTAVVPSFSITGNSSLCTATGQYQINGLPCGASVAWSSSNTNIATVPASGNPVTVSHVGSSAGNIVLTAVVSGLCSGANQTITLPVAVGAGAVVPSFSPGYWTTIPNPPTMLTGSSCFTSANNGVTLSYSGVSNLSAIPYDNSNYPVVRANSIGWNYPVGRSSAMLRVDYDVACGHVTQVLQFNNSCNGFAFVLSPNPSVTDVTVSSDTKTSEKSSLQPLLYAIKISDNLGNLRKTFSYKSGVASAKISVADLNAGTYLISVFDGSKWNSQSLVIHK